MNKWIKDGKFTPLSDSELKDFEVGELASYHAAKTTDQVKTLIKESKKDTITGKELDKRIENLNKDIKKMSNDEMAKLKTDIDKVVLDLSKANEALVTQGAEMKALKEIGKAPSDQPKTFKGALRAAIMEQSDKVLKEIDDNDGKRLSFKDYLDNHDKTPKFVMKVADMLESNIVQSEVSLVRMTELDPNRVGIPLTIYPHVLDWMPKKGIKKANMSVLVVYDYEDGAATKTEGSASTQSDFLLKTVEFKAFYIATFFTLSDETLDDLDEVMDEINITAPSKILDKVDGYVLGTSGDDSTAIAGLYTANKHTDFATLTYTATVNDANIIDLIAKAKLQCSGSKYLADAVIMHPTDIDNMGALKDANDNSILDRRVKWDNLGNPSMVSGMKIIASTSQTVDTLGVVASKQLIIGMRKEMTLEIGHNATDLTEGQKTVVIKIRLAFGVRDKAAIIYSDGIAADVAAINKV